MQSNLKQTLNVWLWYHSDKPKRSIIIKIVRMWKVLMFLFFFSFFLLIGRSAILESSPNHESTSSFFVNENLFLWFVFF